MKRRWFGAPFVSGIVFILAASRADAQTPARVRSPQIATDGAATLRLRAPDARVVQALVPSRGVLEMNRDERGVWFVERRLHRRGNFKGTHG